MNDQLELELNSRLANSGEAIADLTAELVAIPTENPPGRHYSDLVALLETRLTELGMAPTIIPGPPVVPGEEPRQTILVGHESDRRKVVFHGHYDVVPADDPDQFTPVRQWDRVTGRGSADMKGGLAAMIYAAKTLRELDPVNNGGVALTIVPDEETGGMRGSGYLVENGLLGTNVIGMISPEPTSGVIWNACRGAITLRVTVRGRNAHVGQHYLGSNAFESMLTVATRLQQLAAVVNGRITEFDLSSEPDPVAAKRSILMMGGEMGGGVSFNAVPSYASFTVERRFNPEESLDDVRTELLSVLEECRQLGIELEFEVLQDAPSAAVAATEPLITTLAQAAEETTGVRPAIEMCPGLLEIRWYAHEGIPAVAFGPGLLSVSHGPGESISVGGMIACAQIYGLTALRMLSPTGVQ